MGQFGHEFEGEYPREVVASFNSRKLDIIAERLAEYHILPQEVTSFEGFIGTVDLQPSRVRDLYYGARTIQDLDEKHLAFSEISRVYVKQVGPELGNLDFDIWLRDEASTLEIRGGVY